MHHNCAIETIGLEPTCAPAPKGRRSTSCQSPSCRNCRNLRRVEDRDLHRVDVQVKRMFQLAHNCVLRIITDRVLGDIRQRVPRSMAGVAAPLNVDPLDRC